MPETRASVTAQPTAAGSADAAELRRIAVRLAETAAAHVRSRRPQVFGPDGARDGAVRTKGHPTDPVTIVDTETEDLIRRLLAEARPDDPILGEEGGGSLADSDADTVHWVVDPIDGTVNFLYGIPGYAISVAAMRAGRSVAGAVVDVARAATYSAASGLGATRVAADGSVDHLRCSPVRSAAMALVATGFAYGTHRRAQQAALVAEILPNIRDIRRFGAAALDLCFVAEGRIDAYYEHGLNAWDWAAGALIAAEAGAVLRLPAATSPGSAGELVIAAAPGVADELTELFDRVGATVAIPDA
ncbi:inositol monophosphatase family protein [Nocardia sp. CA-107356]|uniref:inositol monophosphatase family protein n=1 Tax=Nocardia sp. CA-107356 TaxID=3239972 RepID=UPI003D929F8B